MARPRTPLGKAELTGAAAHDPQRFRARSEPETKPIGSPPSWLSPIAKKAWREACRKWPWVTSGDEEALVALCIMREVIETTPPADIKVGLFSEYRQAVSAFGGTPTTRSKVYAPKAEEDDDPFAVFDKRAN